MFLGKSKFVWIKETLSTDSPAFFRKSGNNNKRIGANLPRKKIRKMRTRTK